MHATLAFWGTLSYSRLVQATRGYSRQLQSTLGRCGPLGDSNILGYSQLFQAALGQRSLF